MTANMIFVLLKNRNIVKMWDPRVPASIKTLKVPKDIQSIVFDWTRNCLIAASEKVACAPHFMSVRFLTNHL